MRLRAGGRGTTKGCTTTLSKKVSQQKGHLNVQPSRRGKWVRYLPQKKQAALEGERIWLSSCEDTKKKTDREKFRPTGGSVRTKKGERGAHSL